MVKGSHGLGLLKRPTTAVLCTIQYNLLKHLEHSDSNRNFKKESRERPVVIHMYVERSSRATLPRCHLSDRSCWQRVYMRAMA